MNLRKQLAALFLPTRRLTGTDPDLDAPDAIVQQGGALGGQQWVVPRALCQYRRVDLAAVPQRQRHAAARLAASVSRSYASGTFIGSSNKARR